VRRVSPAPLLVSVLLVSGCPDGDRQDAGSTPPGARDTGVRAPPPPPPEGPVTDATGAAATAACPGRRPDGRDGDADGISDAVEELNARLGQVLLQNGRCDPDPSRTEGKPFDGKLPEGVNLPDKGDGFRHSPGGDPPESDDWTMLAMVQCVEGVGQRLRAQGRELGITDLSRRGGGRFVPHKSHQNGLDGDMRYLRKDKKNQPLDLKRNPELYDADATANLFKLFAELCPVDVIFVDLDHLGFDADDVPVRLAHVAGHSNHFHLRLSAEAGR
jgi:hypothetical protein